ncbi:lytic transglycosylase domain-containing protein [Maritimibacter sp. UBA3975]|uniref:lytic transglycosylase domain-containing protein n=1 Tax=Maritimibacter sp. UBA3975 TaxID=1946833 RepID=UPI0025BA39C0|nr:lytic transglycosylase domain-containing protein [Maritimibacter sp. UBA3975]
MARLAVASVIALCFAALPTRAGGDASAICNQAAALVARESGVPVAVLRAITLTETGRSRNGTTQPWPWTVNMEGKGVWFETADDARAYAYEHYKRGARSFDVGCFQLNYKWHHQAFSSLEEMFDPVAGGRYAADFLTRLYDEKGDWTEAAGAYHSRTKEHADRYKAIFAEHFANVVDSPLPEPVSPIRAASSPVPPPAQSATRVNTFPLLKAGAGARSTGSLVPLGPSSTTRLIDFNGAG